MFCQFPVDLVLFHHVCVPIYHFVFVKLAIPYFIDVGSYYIFYLLISRVYLCKQWQELKVFNDHTALATGVRFGHNASFIASASMDRSLKIFGL